MKRLLRRLTHMSAGAAIALLILGGTAAAGSYLAIAEYGVRYIGSASLPTNCTSGRTCTTVDTATTPNFRFYDGTSNNYVAACVPTTSGDYCGWNGTNWTREPAPTGGGGGGTLSSIYSSTPANNTITETNSGGPVVLKQYSGQSVPLMSFENSAGTVEASVYGSGGSFLSNNGYYDMTGANGISVSSTNVELYSGSPIVTATNSTTAPSISSGLSVYLPTATTPTIAPPSGGTLNLASAALSSPTLSGTVAGAATWSATQTYSSNIAIDGSVLEYTAGQGFTSAYTGQGLTFDGNGYALVKGLVSAVSWSTATPTQLVPSSHAQITATLSANVTSWSIAAGTASDESIVIVFAQDATGSRTLAGAGSTIKWAPSTYHGSDHLAPTLTATANARDTFGFEWDGVNWVETFRNMNN